MAEARPDKALGDNCTSSVSEDATVTQVQRLVPDECLPRKFYTRQEAAS
jgi:hypothetical protein